MARPTKKASTKKTSAKRGPKVATATKRQQPAVPATPKRRGRPPKALAASPATQTKSVTKPRKPRKPRTVSPDFKTKAQLQAELTATLKELDVIRNTAQELRDKNTALSTDLREANNTRAQLEQSDFEQMVAIGAKEDEIQQLTTQINDMHEYIHDLQAIIMRKEQQQDTLLNVVSILGNSIQATLSAAENLGDSVDLSDSR